MSWADVGRAGKGGAPGGFGFGGGGARQSAGFGRSRPPPPSGPPPSAGGGWGAPAAASHAGLGGWGQPAAASPVGAMGGAGADQKKDMSELGKNLRPVDYSREHVEGANRHFYHQDMRVVRRPQTEIQKWRNANKIQVFGREPPNPCITFEECNFPPDILGAFHAAGYMAPTVIQAQSWPAALMGRDVVGVAKTGSGKTHAFGVPGIIHCRAQNPLRTGDGPLFLCVCPTRELCAQIQQEIAKVAGQLRSLAVYGGASRSDQQRQLRAGVEILVATPGRLIDFLESGDTNLKRVTFLVLDEADRMLELGFEDQIRKVVGQIRPDKQTLMWSATWPEKVQKLAQDYQYDWVQIQVGVSGLSANSDVAQHIIQVEPAKKLESAVSLCRQLRKHRLNKMLIFCNAKTTCDQLVEYMGRQGLSALCLHSDKSQQDREQVMLSFRKQKQVYLVSTDVAARGIDVRDLPVILNYDFPKALEDYIHRIGRTGRAGDKGDAYTFFSASDNIHARQLVDIMEQAGSASQPPAWLVALADAQGPSQASQGGMQHQHQQHQQQPPSGWGQAVASHNPQQPRPPAGAARPPPQQMQQRPAAPPAAAQQQPPMKRPRTEPASQAAFTHRCNMQGANIFAAPDSGTIVGTLNMGDNVRQAGQCRVVDGFEMMPISHPRNGAVERRLLDELSAASAPAAQSGPEKRLDPNDGRPYTKAEFFAQYGGEREWNAAPPAHGRGPEMRIDKDGKPYTQQEFVAAYGGLAEWNQARLAP